MRGSIIQNPQKIVSLSTTETAIIRLLGGIK
jgi:hypothetical protein